MARRNPHEEQWAAMVLDAATTWGHHGKSFYDRKRGVVSFVGLGDVALDDPQGFVVRGDLEQQKDHMRTRCNALLARHFQVPAEWMTGDAERDDQIRRALIGVRSHPMAPDHHAQLARFGRELGIAGWEERWRWSATRFVDGGVEVRRAGSVLHGIFMWLELGEPDRAKAPADLVIRNWEVDAPDQDVATVYPTELTDVVMAIYFRDGRGALASVVARRPDFDGNTWVEAFALAALAAETGIVDELVEQVGRLRQMLTVSEREAGAYPSPSLHDRRHVVSIAEGWLAELAPDEAAPPEAPDGARASGGGVRVAEPVSAVGIRSLEWRGDVLVALCEHATVALDLTGVRVLAPPEITIAEPSPDHTRQVDDGIVLDRADGTTIPLRAKWNEDQLEDAEYFEVTWSPTADRFAVWGEYGPFLVFAPDGSPAGSFHNHWKGPNYSVTFAGGDRMLSWARDGRAVVYDLVRRITIAVVEVNGWPGDATIDSTGRVILTNDNVDDWLAHDVADSERIGPVRVATRAVFHPTRPIVGYADAEQVWIEEYLVDDI